MVYRYVPILRWKRGERVALQNLNSSAKRDVVPLLIIGTDQYVGRDATKSRPAIAPPELFTDEMLTSWGEGPFYLDAAALAAGAAHPILTIAEQARNRGLQFVPATTLNALSIYQDAIAHIVATDSRGIALRVTLSQFSSVSSWIEEWPHAIDETDLIVDLGNSVEAVSALGQAVDHVFQSLPYGNQWRTVTMSGTSIPANFAGLSAGTHSLPRAEVQLWRRLSTLNLPYRLDYGDWATVPVNPPPKGIKWGYPINVKYTLPQSFMIRRGVGTKGPAGIDVDVQLRGHARAIARYTSRSRLPSCWGDARVDAIAAGQERPSGLEHWVRISVNRHIEVTRHHLP